MKALSIRQPWASCILDHGKDIENRSWRTLYRGRLLVHASQKLDAEGALFILRHFGLSPALSFGGIIGAVDVVDCIEESPSKWFFGPFGFVLANPVRYRLYPCRGSLSLFDLDVTEEFLQALSLQGAC
jgi:hypothetical protein